MTNEHRAMRRMTLFAMSVLSTFVAQGDKE